MDDPPEPSSRRIRHISGVGIHELTLPSGPGASLGLGGSPRLRRTSHASIEPPHGRARAPTLAGEAYRPQLSPGPGVVPEEDEVSRTMARCFVAISLPDPDEELDSQRQLESPSEVESPTRVKGRSRTTSLPPKPDGQVASSSSITSERSVVSPGPSTPTAKRRPPSLKENGSARHASSPGEKRAHRPPPIRRSTLAFPSRGIDRQSQSVPFFLAPIHKPSTHPRWADLEPGDLAPWLTVPEAAGMQVQIDVWYEERGRWKRLPGVGGLVDLRDLVPIPMGTVLPPNTIEWTFSSQPKHIFYLPTIRPEEKPTDEKNIVERSLRETRMKKGATVGGLHQLVNIQSVIADTQRSIETLQRKIDDLISADADRVTVRRDIGQSSLRIRWVRDRVAEVERTIEEAKAKIVLQRGRLDARKALLTAAVERGEQIETRAKEIVDEISNVESERTDLLPKIYSTRARHAQALDQIFPIVPVSASALLYSILDIPLPIPQGPKDPAPPLALSPAQTPEGCPKVDERTTAAALGYAALLVHLIASLGGAAASLAYPVTYAGSRSHVRDVVSAMQGPRSFPLYGRGVERYRYEYAVFLLNKDIELLMHEHDIRKLDLRHTLPNLKNLLLTLSSPVPPPPGPVTGPGWASGAGSRASSRQASWSFASGPGMPGAITPRMTSLNLSRRSYSLASVSMISMDPTSAEPTDGGESLSPVRPHDDSDTDTVYELK